MGTKGGSADDDGNYWTKMMSVIREEIQDYRSELDALTMKRTQMERKLKQVRSGATIVSTFVCEPLVLRKRGANEPIYRASYSKSESWGYLGETHNPNMSDRNVVLCTFCWLSLSGKEHRVSLSDSP